MEHVVFSAAGDGVGEEFRRVSSLEEAVRVVEHLRNDLGVEDATVFSLTPVPLAFRTYYRVEIPEVTPVAPVAEPIVAETHEPPAPEPEAYQPEEAIEFEPALSEVPQLAELPATLSPGLEPREAESEHSLGYFTR